jgi:hypothetical protein
MDREISVKHIKLPKKVCDEMKNSFKQNTAKFFQKKGIKFTEVYKLSIDNLEDMLWFEENQDDKYDEIRIHFTYYKTSFISGYSELHKYDDSLFFIYSRAFEKRELGDFFAIYSFNNQLSIQNLHFEVIRDKFTDLFTTVVSGKPMITEKGFTSFIMVPRMELLAYYAKIALYNKKNEENKIKQINICLAEALEKTQIERIKQEEIDNNGIHSSIIKDFDKTISRDYMPNQLTVIFDAIDELDNFVENLSSYDMNSLCPNQCP